MTKKQKRLSRIVIWTLVIVLALATAFFVFYIQPPNYVTYEVQEIATTTPVVAAVAESLPKPFVVTHIKTPEAVKAIYMTGWVGGSEKLRSKLIKLIDDTELNSIVIDIKDYTGKISFHVENPELKAFGSGENRIPDIKELIGRLHDKGVYVIGRISTFQDSYLVKTHPEYAVKTKEGTVWKDYKGVSWLDAGAKPVWDYIASIGDEAYSVGFDELNFDYIRFPSDGNMKDIAYTYSEGRIKSDVLKDFFAFLDENFHAKNIPISADLFGMTTSNKDDLGIGQLLENALAHFDYVAPMVYPSHYPANFNGMKNPSTKPYETIQFAMSRGVERAIAASTTPSKLRPWLQDFSIRGTDYTPEMIRLEKKATYDVGLNSWMMWNASNNYTASALDGSEMTNSTTTAVAL